jgi:N-acetylmuramoyl-L-alanine amidase
LRRGVVIAVLGVLLIALACLAWSLSGKRCATLVSPARAAAQDSEEPSGGAFAVLDSTIAPDSTLGVTIRFSDSRPPLAADAYWRDGEYYFSDASISAAMGITVKWDPLFRLVTLAGRRGEATATVGGTAAILGGASVNLPYPFLEEPGTVLVPLTFLELGLQSVSGVSASWSEERAELLLSAMEPSVLGVVLGGRPGLARITITTGRPLAYRVLEEEGELRVAVKGAVADSAFSVHGAAMSPVAGWDAQWQGDELLLKVRLGGQAKAFQTFREKYPQAIVLLVSSTAYLEGFDLEPLVESRGRWGRPRPIVLDPAHGGDDWGAVGAGGLKEKDVVLSICLKAASILRDRLGVDVYLTRDSDYRVPAAGRAEAANSRGADVFLSVHCDSWPGGGRLGYGACVMPPAAVEGGYWSPEAKRTSEVQERDLAAAPALMPWRRLQGRFREESRRLAQSVLKQIAVVDDGPSHGIREIELVSLIGVDAPAVCVQCGYLDNRQDLRLLDNSEGRDRLAAALARGIEEYIAER